MKTTRLTILALALIASAACQKADRTGQLVFSLEEGEVADVVTKGNVTDYAALPSENSFNLTIKDSKSATVYAGTIGDWSPAVRLGAGNYTAEVSYGSDAEEGPEKPYFAGSTAFSLAGGETTTVTIPVTLGNSVVKVSTTAAFKNYYPTSTFTVTTPDNSFTWDGKPIFVAYQFSVGGAVTNQAGQDFTLETKTWKGDAATCYTVKYDVNNVGGVTVAVSFNDNVESVDLGETELND